jgi:hypothetical protein
MADQVLGIAPQKDTHTNWVSANPTLGKDSGGKSYGQIILSTDSPIGDILVWGNDQTYNVAYAAGQYSQVQFPTRSGVLAKSADYTILDTDPDIIEVTTAATDLTITLPTLADNQGRRIKIAKVDDGAGKVTIDCEGAETIDGVTNIDIDSQYDMAVLEAGSTGWHLVQYKDHGSNANGSWERFADGTMRQWGTSVKNLIINISGLGGTRTAGVSEDLPISFVNASYDIVCNTATIKSLSCTSYPSSASQFIILHWAVTSQAAADLTTNFIATGRWRA